MQNRQNVIALVRFDRPIINRLPQPVNVFLRLIEIFRKVFITYGLRHARGLLSGKGFWFPAVCLLLQPAGTPIMQMVVHMAYRRGRWRV
ncbi:hypothetical protein Pan189_38100 [Stratiformator vulcanicus]|uniref:Uncharacterized protein n=1 Tax=Stratiformator vulcanicus TaxID=2527980 RepID=A0A517R6D9_9PLAN|nr:hypothetical protein Pan189_38100 [Stratiformator vulcanicus]